MSLLLAFAVAVAFTLLLIAMASLWVVIYQANRTALAELKEMQGGFRNVFIGKLAKPPVQRDYRVITGLEWDSARNDYSSQSRLSVEALKSVFFTR